MNAWYLLAGLGAVLALTGLVAVFKIKGSGDNQLKLPGGIEIKSATPGGFVCAMGVLLAFVGVLQGTHKQGSHVTSVTLTTDTGGNSAQYNVLCPINVELVGAISLTGDPGTVSYRLDRQDGLDGPITPGEVRTVAFDGPGTQKVTFDVPVTIPEGTVYFATRLVTIDPTDLHSDAVQVTVTCNPDLPPGPPGPPPSVSPPS
jgi:hypothetical protein